MDSQGFRPMPIEERGIRASWAATSSRRKLMIACSVLGISVILMLVGAAIGRGFASTENTQDNSQHSQFAPSSASPTPPQAPPVRTSGIINAALVEGFPDSPVLNKLTTSIPLDFSILVGGLHAGDSKISSLNRLYSPVAKYFPSNTTTYYVADLLSSVTDEGTQEQQYFVFPFPTYRVEYPFDPSASPIVYPHPNITQHSPFGRHCLSVIYLETNREYELTEHIGWGELDDHLHAAYNSCIASVVVGYHSVLSSSEMGDQLPHMEEILRHYGVDAYFSSHGKVAEYLQREGMHFFGIPSLHPPKHPLLGPKRDELVWRSEEAMKGSCTFTLDSKRGKMTVTFWNEAGKAEFDTTFSLSRWGYLDQQVQPLPSVKPFPIPSPLPLSPIEYDDSSVFRMLFVGDWGRSTTIGASINRVGKVHKPNFIVSTGDNFYESGIDSVDDPKIDKLWVDQFSGPKHPNISDVPWFVVLGNHDTKNSTAQLLYTLKNPQWNAPAMWYRLEYPLDYSTPRVFLPESPYAEALHGYKPPAYAPQSTMDKKYAPKGTGDCISILYVYAEGLNPNVKGEERQSAFEAQREWVDVQLGLARKSCKISFVVGHSTLRSSGRHHRSPLYKIEEVLEKHEVDAYICGHDHNLEYLRDGSVDYIVSGSGSGSYGIPKTFVESSVFFAFNLGFVEVDVVGKTGELVYTFYGRSKGNDPTTIFYQHRKAARNWDSF